MLERIADVVGMIPEAISGQRRAEAGREMEEDGCAGQVNGFLYKIRSSSRNGGRAAKHTQTYDVVVVVVPDQLYWCPCGDRKHCGIVCKHIHAALAHMRKAEGEDAAGARFAGDAAVESMTAATGAAAAAAALGDDAAAVAAAGIPKRPRPWLHTPRTCVR